MVSRAAGWGLLPAQFGYINHYFSANQTKALCGRFMDSRSNTYNVLTKAVPVCKRCDKYLKAQQLADKKKKRK